MNRNLALLKTLLAHAGEVPAIIANVRELANGPGWVHDRVEPSHHLIELLYPIFDEVDELLSHPVESINLRAIESETADLKATAVGLGINWLELVNIVIPVILKVYELLRALRNNQPVQSSELA